MPDGALVYADVDKMLSLMRADDEFDASRIFVAAALKCAPASATASLWRKGDLLTLHLVPTLVTLASAATSALFSWPGIEEDDEMCKTYEAVTLLGYKWLAYAVRVNKEPYLIHKPIVECVRPRPASISAPCFTPYPTPCQREHKAGQVAVTAVGDIVTAMLQSSEYDLPQRFYDIILPAHDEGEGNVPDRYRLMELSNSQTPLGTLLIECVVMEEVVGCSA